jgi:hypothetical protein
MKVKTRWRRRIWLRRRRRRLRTTGEEKNRWRR